jgi:hypothetical protein
VFSDWLSDTQRNLGGPALHSTMLWRVLEKAEGTSVPTELLVLWGGHYHQRMRTKGRETSSQSTKIMLCDSGLAASPL